MVGAIAGFLSGLFGIGGGILIVPGLVLLMRMSQRLAHATSLAAIVPIAVSGVTGFALHGSVDWVAAALLMLGATGGVALGTRALHRLSANALRLTFAAFLIATAVRLLLRVPEASGRGDLDAGMAVGLILVGVLAGMLAGLLGVGGGIVMVPALIMLFSTPDAVAKGTSLLVIIPTAILGTSRNIRMISTDLRIAAIVGLVGVASAFGASQLAVNLDPRVSGVLFAMLLIAVAARMLLTGRTRVPTPDQPGPADAT